MCYWVFVDLRRCFRTRLHPSAGSVLHRLLALRRFATATRPVRTLAMVSALRLSHSQGSGLSNLEEEPPTAVYQAVSSGRSSPLLEMSPRKLGVSLSMAMLSPLVIDTDSLVSQVSQTPLPGPLKLPSSGRKRDGDAAENARDSVTRVRP